MCAALFGALFISLALAHSYCAPLAPHNFCSLVFSVSFCSRCRCRCRRTTSACFVCSISWVLHTHTHALLRIFGQNRPENGQTTENTIPIRVKGDATRRFNYVNPAKCFAFCRRRQRCRRTSTAIRKWAMAKSYKICIIEWQTIRTCCCCCCCCRCRSIVRLSFHFVVISFVLLSLSLSLSILATFCVLRFVLCLFSL